MKPSTLLNALTVICLLGSQSLSAQIPTFEWAKRMGGASYDEGQAIAVDAYGNVYTTGMFSETADFDQGDVTLTSAGGHDIFIQKLDTSGNLLWVKQMGGAFNDIGISITLDVDGNVYTTGSFTGTVDFDPGEGTANLTSAGDSDVFVQKLDSNGNFLWARQMGGSSSDHSASIAVDASGNVYTTGFFSTTADFDPGEGTANLTSAGMYDIFVQKLNTNGDFLWVRQMGGAAYDYGTSIALDASVNVYTTGSFRATVKFDPAEGAPTLISGGESDVFIQKLDTDGNFIWAKQVRGDGEDMGRSIALDASGNIYVTGFFEGTADFDPGVGAYYLYSVDNTSIFVLKLNTHGQLYWAKQMGGYDWDYGHSIAVDAYGDVYTTGYFEGEAYFDLGSEMFYLTSTGSKDVFVQKLNTHGDFLWVAQMGGIHDDVGHSIAVNASGNVYTTGYFNNTVDFDPGVGTATLTSAGASDIFVQKLSQPGYIPTSVSNAAGLPHYRLAVYPNPSSGIFNIAFEKPVAHAILTVTDINGKLISTTQIQNASKASIELNEASGVYLLTIKSKDGQKTVQLIVE